MKSTALRAAVVIAAVYGYFLIFAQFAFLELLRSEFSGRIKDGTMSAASWEKTALGAMAVAGIASGFIVAWRGSSPRTVRCGFLLAAVVSATAPWMRGAAWTLAEAALTGAAVGIATVGLAPLLRGWCGLFWVGLGTGLGYSCCNLPFVFSQPPSHQAWVASFFALAGALAVPAGGEIERAEAPEKVFSFAGALVIFTVLVWLDSAAFFIIQHEAGLKSGTWGDGMLWRNAAIHLITALAAGIWLRKGGARVLPGVAWLLLATASIAVNGESTRELCGWLYPGAVSLYSAALVAWPAWFSGVASPRAVTWRAAWIYAVAGWFGSANGIGMAQTLERVPFQFIVVSGVLVFAVMLSTSLKRWRIPAAAGVVLAAAFLPRGESPPATRSAVERGKQVYLSEGCIHCHSRYVRPGTRDEEYWGPALGKVDDSRPVLIGNRRQGPDLGNIGARRSPAWLREHFLKPEAFSPGTTMPGYAHLFEDGRGADLVSYLSQSGADQMQFLMSKNANWKPSGTASSHPDARELFFSQCSVCHGPEGRGNGPVAANLAKQPADLAKGPFVWTPVTMNRELAIARIIKFGLPGTDMPGHETLEDGQVKALAAYVLGLRK